MISKIKLVLRRFKFLRLINNLFIIKTVNPRKYPRKIHSMAESNDIIFHLLNETRPILIGRFGSVELGCVNNYLKNKGLKRAKIFPETTVFDMENNAGFFPSNQKTLIGFAEEYLRAASELDALGVWYSPGEDLVVKQYCTESKLIPLQSIEPYFHLNPWSRVLRGKTVLVIHPFIDSIEKNYKLNRERLFSDPDVLPPFTLIGIKAVQSQAGEETIFTDWFQALESMKSQMEKVDFDICIVGAGAYGLPLAAHAKSLGKKAVHLGGATQILFGIKGKRWEDHTVISKLFNDFWIRPSKEEVPGQFQSIEGGCYW